MSNSSSINIFLLLTSRKLKRFRCSGCGRGHRLHKDEHLWGYLSRTTLLKFGPRLVKSSRREWPLEPAEPSGPAFEPRHRAPPNPAEQFFHWAEILSSCRRKYRQSVPALRLKHQVKRLWFYCDRSGAPRKPDRRLSSCAACCLACQQGVGRMCLGRQRAASRIALSEARLS